MVAKLTSLSGSVMEDPSAQGVAQVYAAALLDAAGPDEVEGALEEFRSFLEDVLAQYPEFDSLLRSGMLSRDEKLSLIERAVQPQASPRFTSFLKVLARHNRMELLPVVLRMAEFEHERRQGRQRVQVTSVQELSEQTRQAVKERLEAVLPFEPIIEAQADPSLLGGLIIRVGDTVYDGSLKTRIKQLRAGMRERCVNEIQRGRDRFSYPEGN